MSQAAPTRGTFLAGLRPLQSELATQGPNWLRELRRDGLARFEADGLPTSRLESWKNTNLAPLGRLTFQPPATQSGSLVEPPAIATLDLDPAVRMRFRNGTHLPEASEIGSLPEGVWVGTLTEALERFPERLERLLSATHEEAAAEFRALNGAFLRDGAVVLVDDGVTLERPIELRFLSGCPEGPVASNLRTLIVAGARAKVSVVEIYASTAPGPYFTNAVSDAIVGEGAQIDHVRLQLESAEAYHISTSASTQARDSRYNCHSIDLGGKLVRHNVRGVLDGEGGNCHLNGLYLVDGSSHVDNHTTLDHAKPHCDSRELYKGILSGEARSVFSGRIIVREDAQKTDAKQSNPNLLLSTKALAHTRPQLEIYADDVKCTHGATMGQMDRDAIFYLRSRGIDEVEARNMLVHAFAGEVLQEIPIPRLVTALGQLVAERLPAGKDIE